MNTKHELLTIKEVADYFRVSISSVRNFVRKGWLHPKKPSWKLLFERSDLERFLNERTEQ